MHAEDHPYIGQDQHLNCHHAVKDPPSEALENIRLQGVFNKKRVTQVVWFMKEGVQLAEWKVNAGRRGY